MFVDSHIVLVGGCRTTIGLNRLYHGTLVVAAACNFGVYRIIISKDNMVLFDSGFLVHHSMYDGVFLKNASGVFFWSSPGGYGYSFFEPLVFMDCFSSLAYVTVNE